MKPLYFSLLIGMSILAANAHDEPMCKKGNTTFRSWGGALCEITPIAFWVASHCTSTQDFKGSECDKKSEKSRVTPYSQKKALSKKDSNKVEVHGRYNATTIPKINSQAISRAQDVSIFMGFASKENLLTEQDGKIWAKYQNKFK